MTPHKHFTNPDDQRRGPNCGVTATAICAGVSFGRAWNAFKMLGRSKYGHRNWQGRTITSDQAKVLDRLGVEFETYSRGTCDAIGRTLSSFCKEWTLDGVLYMVTTSGHVQSVMRQGDKVYVIDQAGPKLIGDHWGKRKKVRVIRRIKTPFKHAAEEKAKPATIPPQSHDTLFPSLFRDSKRNTAHTSATQLTLF